MSPDAGDAGADGAPAAAAAEPEGPGPAERADIDPAAVTAVFPLPAVRARRGAEPIETDAGTGVAAAKKVGSHDAMDVESEGDPAAVTAVFASPVPPARTSGDPTGTDADTDTDTADTDTHTDINTGTQTDTNTDADPAAGADIDADPGADANADIDAGFGAGEGAGTGADDEAPVESDLPQPVDATPEDVSVEETAADETAAEEISAEETAGGEGGEAEIAVEGVPAADGDPDGGAAPDLALDAADDAGGADVDADADDAPDDADDEADAGAVTTMFTVVTEETREDADTTSFAVVSLDAGDLEAGTVARGDAGTGTPPGRRPRPRAVLFATAGAVAVVVLGVAAAAAFGGERSSGGPASAPVASAPAPVPSASPTAPAKPFPRYPGTKSLSIGRIIDRKAHLSYSRLGGKWSLGRDRRKLATALGVSRKGPQLRGIMEAGRAEYLSAPLPASLGSSATPEAAQAVARKVIGTGQAKPPTLRTYASERLTGGLQGWWVGFQALTGSTDGEIVAVAVVETGAARPGVFYVAVPKGDKTVRPDIRALVKSLRIVR